MKICFRMLLVVAIATFSSVAHAQELFQSPPIQFSMMQPVSYKTELVSHLEEASFGGGPVSETLDAPHGKSPCQCGKADCCQAALHSHRTGIYGELLYLRLLDSEVTYATPANGPIVAPPAPVIQTGPQGIVDHDFEVGFRVGMDYCLDECSSLRLGYTFLQSTTNDRSVAQAPEVLAPILLHPATGNAGTDALAAFASYDIDWEQVDFMYRAVLAGDCDWVINYAIGARYLHLQQDLRVRYTFAGTEETILNRVGFDGAGLALGLDSMKRTARGWLLYGRGNLGFVAGEFRGRYAQGSNFDPSIVDASWKAGRLVTAADLELGGGYETHCERFRVTAGFMVGGWFNIVSTDEFIQAVHANNFVGLEDRMTVAGGVARFEYLW